MSDNSPYRIPLGGVSNAYYVSTPTDGQLPYVALNIAPQTDIAIDLPPEFATTAKPVTVGPFSFNPATDTLSLTLSGRACWDFTATGTPIRGTIRTAYDSFILQLEAQGKVPPPWIRQIQEMIASYLPSSFQETLYFKYRYDAAQGYLDLVPGMRLRVDNGAYQFVYPAGQPGGNPLLAGFVGNGTSYLNIRAALTPGGDEAIVFDPFFGSLAHSAVAPNKGGAAGLLDFAGGAYLKPYYRLFYPKTPASSDGPGVSDTTGNITIVGANTLANLKLATDAYLQSQTVPVGETICATFFRGRATVTPEIGIFLQTRAIYVSLGTTIRQVYAAHAPIGRAAGQTFPAGVSQRLPALFQYTSNAFPSFLPLSPFPAGGATAPYKDCTDGLDLPVLAGDAYQLRIANQ